MTDEVYTMPSRAIQLATEYLAKVVQEDMGTKNGQTALYWHLINVVQQHAGIKSDSRTSVTKPEKEEIKMKKLMVVSGLISKQDREDLREALGPDWTVWNDGDRVPVGIHFDVIVSAVGDMIVNNVLTSRLSGKEAKLIQIMK